MFVQSGSQRPWTCLSWGQTSTWCLNRLRPLLASISTTCTTNCGRTDHSSCSAANRWVLSAAELQTLSDGAFRLVYEAFLQLMAKGMYSRKYFTHEDWKMTLWLLWYRQSCDFKMIIIKIYVIRRPRWVFDWFDQYLTCAGCEPAQNHMHPPGRHSRDLHNRGTETHQRDALTRLIYRSDS